MAQTYAQNLATVQTLQTCGSGFVAFIMDPSVDLVTVKDGTCDDACGTSLVFKNYYGAHAEIECSAEPDSGVA